MLKTDRTKSWGKQGRGETRDRGAKRLHVLFTFFSCHDERSTWRKISLFFLAWNPKPFFPVCRTYNKTLKKDWGTRWVFACLHKCAAEEGNYRATNTCQRGWGRDCRWWFCFPGVKKPLPLQERGTDTIPGALDKHLLKMFLRKSSC